MGGDYGGPAAEAARSDRALARDGLDPLAAGPPQAARRSGSWEALGVTETRTVREKPLQ